MDCESDEINSEGRERKRKFRQTLWRQHTSEQQHEKESLPSVTHYASTQLEQKPAQGILGMGATKSSALATWQTAFNTKSAC